MPTRCLLSGPSARLSRLVDKMSNALQCRDLTLLPSDNYGPVMTALHWGCGIEFWKARYRVELPGGWGFRPGYMCQLPLLYFVHSVP